MAKKTAVHDTIVIRDATEADAALREIGDLNRKIAGINDQLNDEIARITEQSSAMVQVLADSRDPLKKALQRWATKNRDDLTQGKTKSVKLPSGVIGWRINPPSLVLKNGVIGAIDFLWSNRGLRKYVVVKRALDKKGLLAAPNVIERIPGASTKQSEQFFIEPLQLDAELRQQ